MEMEGCFPSMLDIRNPYYILFGGPYGIFYYYYFNINLPDCSYYYIFCRKQYWNTPLETSRRIGMYLWHSVLWLLVLVRPVLCFLFHPLRALLCFARAAACWWQRSSFTDCKASRCKQQKLFLALDFSFSILIM
jgi:hypothetical protein